jgi:hypothetical protein
MRRHSMGQIGRKLLLHDTNGFGRSLAFCHMPLFPAF